MNGRTLMVSVGRQARILTERTANAFGHKPQPLAAVVLTSSSRSGSTWLADMLSTAARLQQIFEPLHPRYDPTISSLTGFDARRDHVCSYYLRASGDYPEWHRWWQAVLAGRQRSAWTDAVPTVWFANGYLVKVIRANLMLGYVHDRFQPRLIYLVRHPCAVVQSRLALGWKADVRVLLEQEALVEDYLRPWIAWIENETDPAGAHALWWAVENLVAQSELA
ncbi:MAG: hypothetical protein ACK2U9_11730, partial [Anaerolineae bacterium]